MKKIDNRDMLKISELAKATTTPTSTIHYYVQAGLLTAPVRTSRNMAYYDQSCVQEIQQIQELQNQQYLPLSVIKLLMQAKREGQGPNHLAEMRSFMDKVFQPLPNSGGSRALSRPELAEASGVTEGELSKLENSGFIAAAQTPSGPRFDDIDQCIASIFGKLSAIGVRAADLEVFKPYMAALRAETRAMHEMVHSLPNHEELPLVELLKMINDFKQCLAQKVFRQETLHFGEQSRRKEKDAPPNP